MSSILLIIEADENDADYVTRQVELTIEGFNTKYKERLDKIAKLLNKNRGEWFTAERVSGEEDPKVIYKDLLTEDEITWFGRLVPYSEYGIHTIESIKYYYISEKVKIY